MNLILPIVVPVIIVTLVVILFTTGYLKAPPDTVFIISGLKKRVVVGKSALKIPFFERVDKLSLKLVPIDVTTSSTVPTADYININVDANVNIKISAKPDMINLASQNFLNQPTTYIAKVAREVLEGNMREIVGKMTLEEMVSDRQKFADLVKENSEPDLKRMGLEIVSFNVQNFTDGQGVIDNLGVDNVVKISKNAAISRANAEKEIAVAQAQATKEANDAKIIAETEIAKRNTELSIQKADLKRQADIKKAEADAAYTIQEQEQKKTILTTEANANLAKLEKEIELKERAVAITERELEASVKKQAEASKYAQQQAADAKLYTTEKNSEAELFQRQKLAEAEKFEAIQAAEALKAKAEAEKYKKQQEAEATKAAGTAEAEIISAKGAAEAEAIRAKAIAEAEGIMKKAEAMKQYGEAAQMEMQLKAVEAYFNQLPAIAQAVASPMSQIDSITMYGDSNTAKLTGDITKTIKQITDGVKDATGMDPMAMLTGFLGGKLGAVSNN